MVGVCQHIPTKLIFVENDEIYKKIEGLENEVESLKFIFSFDKLSNVKNWEELIELGLTTPQFEKMNAIQNSISDDDLFTLIYKIGIIHLKNLKRKIIDYLIIEHI